LFEEQFVNLTRGMNAERNAFAVRVSFYLLFGALLVATNLIIDYAKVRLVVEDRRSALGASAAALRFVRHHPRQTIGLYAMNVLTLLVVLTVWSFVAPGVGGTGFGMWVAFVLSQLYIAARLLLKLQFMASQTALFQGKLAHASYTSAPAPAWPDSPAAEAIRPPASLATSQQ
jgi:hypothetical protein